MSIFFAVSIRPTVPPWLSILWLHLQHHLHHLSLRLCNHTRLSLILWSMAHVLMLEKSPYYPTKQLDKGQMLIASNPNQTVCVAVFQKDSTIRNTKIVKLQTSKIMYLKSAKQLDITIKEKQRQYQIKKICIHTERKKVD